MGAGMNPVIIDVHCHVVSPDREKYPLAPIGGKQSDWSSERPTTPEQLISAMDAAGVAKAAVVQASTAYGHDSSYLADALTRFPKRFTGVFSIDPLDPKALEHMDRWTSLGMTGMRVFTTGSTMPGQQTWLDDERAYPVWEKAGHLKLPVAMQMTAEGIPLLLKIVKAFPGTDFLLDHLARPVIGDGAPYAAAQSLWDIAPYKNIYLKLTPRIFVDVAKGKASAETFFPKLVSVFGAERLAWGSNCPASEGTMKENLEPAKKALSCLSAADQLQIFAKTAQSLYPTLKD